MRRSSFPTVLLLSALVAAAVIFAGYLGLRYVYPLKYRRLIAINAQRGRVDPYLVSAVIYEESRWRDDVRSRAGALGLMQLMPETAAWVAAKTGRSFKIRNLTIPRENIAMGVWYYSRLRQKYGSEKLALAAYNGGDKNLDKWLRRHKYGSDEAVIKAIPFKETRRFVRRVEMSKKMYRLLYPRAF